MVKVKIKNIKQNNTILQPIVEETNTPTNEPVQDGIKPQFSLQKEVLKDLTSNIIQEFDEHNTLIKIKLTKKFQDIIRFPDAPAMLDALMVAAQFPPKFFNVHDAIAANPTQMIQKSPDFAFKAFTNTEWNITPEYNKDGSIKVSSKQNESYTPVNEEALSTAAGVVGGVALGTYTMGVASVAFNSDHGVYVTNDKEYKKEYETERTVGALNSTSLVEGIDYYLTNISKNFAVLLRQCTSPNNNKEIEDVLNTISTLSTRANTRIKSYLNDNNESLRKIQEIEQRERENRYRDKASLNTDIKDIILQCIQDGNTTALNDIKGISTRSQLDSFRRKYGINEGVQQYIYSNYINEVYSDGDDIIQMDPFDADALYNEVRGNLREKIIKIMTSDPEEWTDVKWARQQMEQMKTDVDKEIKERIKLVCRMADSGQLGLSSKLASFVSKHPLRAEGLTGIWNRHMRDLDERIQRRIKHISTPESGSPIAMTIEFLQETVPNVIAMMITYKCLAQLLSDSRVQSKHVNATVEKEDKDAFIKQELNNIPDILEQLFATYGHNLNINDKPIYDKENHDFTGNSMDYLSIFMFKIFNNKITPSNVKVFTKIVEDLLSVQSDVDLFFNKFIQILTENNLINLITNFELIDIFRSVHSELNKMQLINTAAQYIDSHTDLISEKNRSIFNYVLSRILASEGTVLNNFKTNRDKILSGNTTIEQVNDLLKLKSIPEDKILVWTNFCETLKQDDDIKLVLSIKDPYIKLLNIYYTYRLNICKNYNNDQQLIAFNPELTVMFINMLASTAIQNLVVNQIDISDLIYLNESYLDIDEFYTALHEYVDISIEDKLDYNDLLEYQKGLVPILQSSNLQLGQLLKTLQLAKDDIKLFQGINNISDIGNIIGLKVDTLEKFITSCTKSYLDNITDNNTVSKANNIFKLVLKAVVIKYDNDFKSYDITSYKDFVNNGKSIVDNIKDITFTRFCTDYHIIYDIMNKPANTNFTSNIQQMLSNIETKINQAIIDALNSKYQIKMISGFNLFGINGILYNIGSANNIDENNYIDAISSITIEKNGIQIPVKDDINIKTILCNFLPIVFKMNTVKQLINAIYNKNGK